MRTTIVLAFAAGLALTMPTGAQTRYTATDGKLRVALTQQASAIGFATIPLTDEGGLSIAALNRMIAAAVRGIAARERK